MKPKELDRFQEHCNSVERILMEREEADPDYSCMKEVVERHLQYCMKINGIKLHVHCHDEGPECFSITPTYLDGDIIDHRCEDNEGICRSFYQAIRAIIDTLKGLKDEFRYVISINETHGVYDRDSFQAKEELLSLPAVIFEVTIIPKKPYFLCPQMFSELGMHIPTESKAGLI